MTGTGVTEVAHARPESDAAPARGRRSAGA